MKISGVNNKVKLGQLLPNSPKQIKSLKDFFYKTAKSEAEIKEIISKDDRIVFEDDEVVSAKPIDKPAEKLEGKKLEK